MNNEKIKKIKDISNKNIIYIGNDNKNYGAAESASTEQIELKIFLNEKLLTKMKIDKNKNLKDLREDLRTNIFLKNKRIENIIFIENLKQIIKKEKEEYYTINKIAIKNNIYMKNEDININIFFKNHKIDNMNIDENKNISELRNIISSKIHCDINNFYFIKNSNDNKQTLSTKEESQTKIKDIIKTSENKLKNIYIVDNEYYISKKMMKKIINF